MHWIKKSKYCKFVLTRKRKPVAPWSRKSCTGTRLYFRNWRGRRCYRKWPLLSLKKRTQNEKPPKKVLNFENILRRKFLQSFEWKANDFRPYFGFLRNVSRIPNLLPVAVVKMKFQQLTFSKYANPRSGKSIFAQNMSYLLLSDGRSGSF